MFWFKKISENKGIEIEINTKSMKWNIFNFNINLSRKCDHAGLYFEISSLWFDLSIRISDFRHWNWEEERYFHDGEEIRMLEMDLEDYESDFKNNKLKMYEGQIIDLKKIHQHYLIQFKELKNNIEFYEGIKDEISDLRKNDN